MCKIKYKFISSALLIGLIINTVSISSAAIYYDSGYKQLYIENEPSISLTDIHNTLLVKYGNSLISNKESSLWHINTSLRIINSTLYITAPEVTDIRWSAPGNSWLMMSTTGSIVIDGVNVIGWSGDGPVTSDPSKQSFVVYNCTIKNSKFENISSLDISGLRNAEIFNLEVTNCSNTFYIRNSENITVSDIYMHDTFGSLVTECIENSSFSNLRFENVPGDQAFGMTNHSTFNNITAINIGEGIWWSDSYYISGADFYIYNTTWSSFAPQQSSYCNFSNITIYRSGHNSIDMHNTKHAIISNVSLYDPDSNNVMITGGTVDAPIAENITMKNVYTLNGGIVSDVGSYDIHIENVLQEGIKDGFGINSENYTLINATSTSNDGNAALGLYSLPPYYAKNNFIIDTNVYHLDADGEWDTKLINFMYKSIYHSKFTKYYYIDMIVVDSDRSPVDSATITFNNEVDDSGFPSVDGYGTNKTTFNTDISGRTPLPDEDRENSPALIATQGLNNGSYNLFTHTATVELPTGSKIHLNGIATSASAHDSSWYRPDPNIPTYTITAIIPDDSPGPHITGFAPSEENPFNPGDEKIFRVWTDENLTSMEWYVDGSLVSEGSLSYTWKVTEGGHAIEFIGSNENGTVSQSWNIGEYTGALPAPIIEFLPTDTILTRNTGENVIFSVSSDQPLTANWSINGELIQNNTTSITQSWDIPGTYNVTVNGYSGEEPIVHTWTVDVIDSLKSQDESTVTVTPDDQIVTPNQPFTIDVRIDPSTPIVAAQFDLQFDSLMVRANSVSEGNLLKQDGAGTLFNSTINNSEGTVTDVYGVIVGKTNVSSEGVFATISMTAGNKTGISELDLSNVRVLDTSITDLPVSIRNASVLVDTAPVLNPIDDKSVSESNTLSFTVDASDADGDSLTYSAAGLPEGANFDPATGEFSWTPATGQAGTYTVTFEVSDGYLTNPEDATITVKSPNRAPVIDSFEPEDGSSFNESEEIDISVSAFDLDGQFLNYIIKINGIKCSTDPSYIWKTNYSSSGEHTVEVTVSDGIDQVTEQHTIYINDYYPPWDVVMNGEVDIVDLATVGQNFETPVSKPYPRYDVNQDGRVNIHDLTLVGYHFGEKYK
ncbi:hypothetical protein MSMTP_2505 [Methanosarcina sp. MTP4]|uniref:putative Ig domain-containing protein n=1 Tax=Methanosarcina sp. MTP4 TaxID=1434100 RepID=UPI0006155148|nr:putative Ig domain-containing protein [Methanosarcina sp. MTP4]AKB25974.1 hypothetical protein MSMTP_2505 [Methanosarcina sp. MTP4]